MQYLLHEKITYIFFFFSHLPHSALLFSHTLIRKYTHATFLYQTLPPHILLFLIELETCFAWETRSLIEHESGVGWTPKGGGAPNKDFMRKQSRPS